MRRGQPTVTCLAADREKADGVATPPSAQTGCPALWRERFLIGSEVGSDLCSHPGVKVMSGQEDKAQFEKVQQRATEARWGADGAVVFGARAVGSPFWMGG